MLFSLFMPNVTGENVCKVYQDLWLTQSLRDVLVDSRLGNENLRKLMSGDDTGADTGDDQKASSVT